MIEHDIERESAFDTASDASGSASLAAAFVCGAITGAAIALLCAPATGRDSRTWLKGQAAAAGSWANDRREQLNILIRRYGVVGVFGRERPGPVGVVTASRAPGPRT